MTATLLDTALTTDKLAALVREVVDNPAAWQPHLRFATGERWWLRLHGDETVDVWLLTWVQDTGTDLHDHGDSAGAFTVVTGVLDEVRPDPLDGSLLTTTRLHGGEVRTIKRGIVHDVRSPFREPAVSIHAYSPPLREMTFYGHDENGAWPTRTVPTAAAADVTTGGAAS
jgi:hypothetical protein